MAEALGEEFADTVMRQTLILLGLLQYILLQHPERFCQVEAATATAFLGDRSDRPRPTLSAICTHGLRTLLRKRSSCMRRSGISLRSSRFRLPTCPRELQLPCCVSEPVRRMAAV